MTKRKTAKSPAKTPVKLVKARVAEAAKRALAEAEARRQMQPADRPAEHGGRAQEGLGDRGSAGGGRVGQGDDSERQAVEGGVHEEERQGGARIQPADAGLDTDGEAHLGQDEDDPEVVHGGGQPGVLLDQQCHEGREKQPHEHPEEGLRQKSRG